MELGEKQTQRRIPIHRSLTRPHLVSGCDRELFIGLCTLCVLLSFSGGLVAGNTFNFALGFILFFSGRAALRHMAKIDTHTREIFARSLKYQEWYPRNSTTGKPYKRRWKKWC